MTKSAFRYAAADGCSDVATHTGEPRGYLQWHAWAAEMAETHRQERCPRCGFWAIWVPRESGKESVDGPSLTTITSASRCTTRRAS